MFEFHIILYIIRYLPEITKCFNQETFWRCHRKPAFWTVIVTGDEKVPIV